MLTKAARRGRPGPKLKPLHRWEMDRRRLSKIRKANLDWLLSEARRVKDTPMVPIPDLFEYRYAIEARPAASAGEALGRLVAMCQCGTLLPKVAVWGELQEQKFFYREIQEAICDSVQNGILIEARGGWEVASRPPSAIESGQTNGYVPTVDSTAGH